MNVALIPCGQTEWSRQGRLLGRVELPLAADAEVQYAAWSEQLRPNMLTRIYHAPDELSRATAEQLGHRLNVPTKVLDELVEVDVGLWAGLTEEELKQRFAKAHRQLLDSPLNVCPPQGEDFSTAADRLRTCLKKRVKSNGKGAVGLVMRPFSLAIVRQVLENSATESIWEASKQDDEPVIVNLTNSPPALVGNA